MSEKPPWRKAIEDFERSIGAPLEEFIKSDEFADMAAKAAKKGARRRPVSARSRRRGWAESRRPGWAGRPRPSGCTR